MAYSSSKKVLFIHIPKNAGKSIEAALGLISKELLERPSLRSPLNRFAKLMLKLTSSSYTSESLFGPLDYTFCAQHLTYSEIEFLGLLNEEELKSSLKLAVVRNPYTRSMSTCRHFCGKCDLDTFKYFWENISIRKNADHNCLAHARTQASFLRRFDGTAAPVEVLRFENLERDFNNLCDREGVDHYPLVPIGAGPSSVNYLDFYDAEACALIEQYFHEDFSAFSYTTIS